MKRERKIFSISSSCLGIYNSIIISAIFDKLDFLNILKNTIIILALSGVSGYISGHLIAFIPYKNIPYKIKYMPASMFSMVILNLLAGIALTIIALQHYRIF